MKKTFTLLLCALLAATMLTGCGQSPQPTEGTTAPTAPAEYVPGTWNGNVYSNTALGFSLNFPESYYILSGDALDQLMGGATVIDFGEEETVSVNTVCEFIAMAPDQISNVMFNVEDNAMNLDAAGYADFWVSSYEAMGVPCEILGQPTSLKLGSSEFYQVEMAVDFSSMDGLPAGSSQQEQTYLIYADEERIYYFTLSYFGQSKEELLGIFGAASEADQTVSSQEKPEEEAAEAFGSFTSLTHTGEEVTEEIFAQAELTLVNFWGTFCSPCVAEMPGLGELAKEYEEAGLQVIGIVADVTEPGDETVQKIIDSTGADYTHIVLSDSLNNGLAGQVQAFPTTVFVDKDGNLVGDAVIGSRDKNAWDAIIRERLDMLK